MRHQRSAPTWTAALLAALTSSCGATSPVGADAPGLSPPPGAAPTVASRLVGQAQRWGLSIPSVDGLVVAEGGAVIDGRTGRTIDVLDAAQIVITRDGELVAEGPRGVSMIDPRSGVTSSGPPGPIEGRLLATLRLGGQQHLAWQLGADVLVRPLTGPRPTLTVRLVGPERVQAFGADALLVAGQGGVAGFRLDGSEIFREPQLAVIEAGPTARAALIDGLRVRAANGELVREVPGYGRLDPTGTRVAFADATHVGIFDVPSGTTRTAATGPIRELAWDERGERLAILGRDGQIAVWGATEDVPRTWATVPDARSARLVGEHVFLDGSETVAVTSAGVVARSPRQGCRFASRPASPLIGVCRRQHLLRFDGSAFQEDPTAMPAVTAELDLRRGLRVRGPKSCDVELRGFGPRGPLISAELAAASAQPAPWGSEGDLHVAASGTKLSVVATTTGAVRATFDAGLGEPLRGALPDGREGAFVWGETAVARRGAPGAPSWRVEPGHVDEVHVVGGRVVVARREPPSATRKQPGEHHTFHVLDAASGATLRERDGHLRETHRRTLLVHDGSLRIFDVHELENLDVSLLGDDTVNSDWAVRREGESIEDSAPGGFTLRSLGGYDAGGHFAEPFERARFARDGTRMVVHTRRAQLVLLEVRRPDDVPESGAPKPLRELARVDVPADFELDRLHGGDLVAGRHAGVPLFVRLDDGRKVWVRASRVGGSCRVTLHDEHAFTGDLDGPVLVRRGGTWLAPDLAPLSEVPSASRPGLLGDLLEGRRR